MSPERPRGAFAALWKTTAGQRCRYAAAVLALALASCFLYLAPLVPQAVLDGVIAPRPAEASALTRGVVDLMGGRSWVAANLWLPALLVAGLTACAGVFTYLRGLGSASATEEVVRRVRDEVYDHLQRLPQETLDAAETGDLIQRCTSDVETLWRFLANQVVEIGRAAIMLLVPLPLMLAIDVRMTAVSVLLLPVIFGFSLVFYRRVKRTFLAADEAEGRLTTSIQENLTGIRVVRAFARQAFEEERFGGRNAEHRDLDMRVYTVLAGFWSVSDLLCFLQTGLVVAAGVWWLAQGTLQVGAFYYFVTAVSMFIFPVRQSGRVLTDLGKAQVALGRLEEVRTWALEADPPAPAALPDPVRGELVLEDVRFAHGDVEVLRGVSLRARPGETVAILGPSGAGKSTIVELLLRLREYTGSIRLDGVELRELPRADVRRAIAVVQQQPFLFSRSLGANLSLGRPEADDREVLAACRAACVDDALQKFEGGLETVVGERGVTLSGGQRQRVALARALVRRPPVLVLDDALSAVDTDTERAVLDGLGGAPHGARARPTTIVIAHRLSTLCRADRVLVLDAGRVVQEGAHAELVKADGPYRRLWELQAAEAKAGGGPAPSARPLAAATRK